MDDYFKRQPEIWQADIHGEQTRTAPHLVSFRDWMIEQMSVPSQTRYINATGAGILRGACIQQASLHDTLAAAPALTGLRERLAGVHRASHAGRQDASIVDTLLARARASRQSLPLDRWEAFAAATVTPDAMVDALLASAAVDSPDSEPAIRQS